jgi:cytochrome c553
MHRTWHFILLTLVSVSPMSGAAEKVSYNRQIRPLLSDQCFACHGPDANKRKANLRLDVREEALKPAKSGASAIVPGKPEQSALVARILATDEDERMPPATTHKSLSAEQKALLGQWIADGAEYQAHWAYLPVVKPVVDAAAANPIDALVAARQQALGLKPAVEAERRTLIRRLYADLHGLPPSPAEVEAFEKDQTPDAYEKLVDRLLSEAAYGERMAVWWLDLVRYADSAGYHSDKERNVSPFRDYVIAAFNQNKPFDQMTIEHLAGDLLPNASLEQRVGSCFNKLLLTTDEGGAQAKDYEARYMQDRARAVGTVWVAQTWMCAQCHDHKFDPTLSKDFYAMGAFFADIDEPIIAAPDSGIPVLEQAMQQAAAAVEAERLKLQQTYDEKSPELQTRLEAWGKAQLEAGAMDAWVKLLEKPAAERSEPEVNQVLEAYKSQAPEFVELRKQLDAVKAKQKALADSATPCIVTRSTPNKRTVRVLPRGNFLDESGPVVTAALPGYLPRPNIEGREPNRMDLAQWLVSPDNPLTSRVLVNRLWKIFYGVGLSKTLEDFGLQGEMPPNAPLLDWLAAEIMAQKWNVKAMVRLMVTSRTYRLTSVATPEMLAMDPENRELTRQSRFRLDAEFVRDFALEASHLLVRKIGGPSVKPYQPDGYWENLNFPARTWQASTGEAQYRRGLYTWWQRMFLHPSLLAFDAPSREVCTAERTRSNIPQQALALLNDPSFVEAARAMAGRVLKEASGDDTARLTWLWREALQRAPAEAERAALLELLVKHRAEFKADVPAATAFGKVGAPAPAELDAAELAAWSSVARVVLNLHEFITRS